MQTQLKLKQFIAAIAVLTASASSQAGIEYVDTIQKSNSDGYGTVNTLLTLNNTDNISSGSVTRVAGADVASPGVQPGLPHSGTYSFGELNITEAGDLLLIFDANEQGNNANNGVTITSLMLSIYTDFGASLFTASLSPIPLAFAETTAPGIKYAFTFALDALSAADAQPFISETNRIGLSASLSGADAGQDFFFVRALDDDGEGPGNENPVPEPASVALLGLGLAGVWISRKRGAKA